MRREKKWAKTEWLVLGMALGVASLLSGAKGMAVSWAGEGSELTSHLQLEKGTRSRRPKDRDKGPGSSPSPFENANRFVELAHGELYALDGTMRVKEGNPYLEIDFKVHPWLASAYRLAHPYYLILSNDTAWVKRDGQRVRVYVQADGLYGDMALIPKAEPEVLVRRRNP